jgi:hypothetical protein
MGMFDNVQCEMELPDGFDISNSGAYGDGGFQTKAFECIMTTYKIERDGTLLVRMWDMVRTGRWFVYDFDKPLWSDESTVWVDPPEDGEDPGPFGEGPIPEIVRANDRWVQPHGIDGSLFTGEFNFYTSGPNDSWHEYLAIVENGIVTEIKDDSDRIKQWRKELNELKAKRNES